MSVAMNAPRDVCRVLLIAVRPFFRQCAVAMLSVINHRITVETGGPIAGGIAHWLTAVLGGASGLDSPVSRCRVVEWRSGACLGFVDLLSIVKVVRR